MSTAILASPSNFSGRGAVCRYYGVDTDMAEGDTIGLTVESDTNLHTVPAGGQTLSEALHALADLIVADGYGASVSENSAKDMCLSIIGGALTLPVYVVA